MAFDHGVVYQRLTAGRARGKRYKLRRKQCIGAERGSYVRRHRRNFFVETDCHEHRVPFIRQRFALFGGEMPHRDHASGRGAGIAYLRVHFYTGHIFIIDLQGACHLFEAISRERESERGEQDDAACDHEQSDEVIGQISLHQLKSISRRWSCNDE